ncbi:MAG: hypothetical protein KY475_02915, partial [Planctomycetes bacterium]|nr:hypothetical protein [Planctomycetota bacterium]
FGGGGFFEVKDGLTDDLNLGVKKDSAAKPAPQAQQPAPRVERPASPAAEKVEPITVTPREGETPAEAWNRRFAEAEQDLNSAAVRETARRLMHKQQFDELIGMLQSAIRHGQAQTWMYEAMSLAMQAAGAPQEELERALMSAVDFSEDLGTVMFVAAYMGRVGLEERALSLFRDVAVAVPHRHEPYLHGLTLAQRAGDQDAIQWACLGIVNRAWPKEERAVLDKALRAAEALLIEMRRDGLTETADEFEQALRAAQARDVRIVVTWTGDADLDLLVEEPSGAVCSLRNQRTVGGGVLLGDTYAGGQGAGIDGYREVYECSQGFDGVYRLLLRRIWGKPTAGQATIDIYTHYGTQQETRIHKQIPIGEKDALILFDLAGGRRVEPLDQAQVEQLARAQFEVNREILARQLAQTEDSRASRSLAADRDRRVRAGALPGGPRRGVGFRPVITTLPEGTNFMATAVISADRRYVRVESFPLFSLIGDVTTFNFATGNTGGGN